MNWNVVQKIEEKLSWWSLLLCYYGGYMYKTENTIYVLDTIHIIHDIYTICYLDKCMRSYTAPLYILYSSFCNYKV